MLGPTFNKSVYLVSRLKQVSLVWITHEENQLMLGPAFKKSTGVGSRIKQIS